MSFNLFHIAEGWGKSLDWLEVTPEVRKLSNERLAICAVCPHAKESDILKFFKGEGRRLEVIYCDECGCPANQKSLVTEEKCPLEKW